MTFRLPRKRLIPIILALMTLIQSIFGLASRGGWFGIPNFMKKSNGVDGGGRTRDDGFPFSEDDKLSDWSANFLKLSNEERMIVEHGHAALARFERKQDCFKEAASMLKNGCRNVNFDDNDKILCNITIFNDPFFLTSYCSCRYQHSDAVRLTKCEIATANLAAPMECDEFDEDVKREYHNYGHLTLATFVKFVRKFDPCQLWLKNEVSQMYMYMPGETDEPKGIFLLSDIPLLDLLEELHRNITHNQLMNYNILRVQQREMISWRKEEMLKLAQLEKFQMMIFDNVNEIEKTTSLVVANMMTLKDNLSETQDIAQHTLGRLSRLNEDLELYRSNSQRTYEDINRQLKHSMEYNENIIKSNIEKLAHILENLRSIESNLLEMSTTQEQVQDDMKEYKDKHRELSSQWDQTLTEAKKNFQLLMNFSQNEIQLLAQTVSDARESQRNIVKILRPLAFIMDLMNLIYGSVSYGNAVKYVIPWLSFPLFRSLISRTGLNGIVALVISFSVLALYLYTDNNLVFLASTFGVLLATLIIKHWNKTNTIAPILKPSASCEPPSFNNLLNRRRIPRFASSMTRNGGNSAIHVLSEDILGEGSFSNTRSRRPGRSYFP
ncbi:8340_t:CDS:10 [Acaulospora morrowiae]|uniref:8340_t:CDS:1 n=1 Tax=Acaulospora morrowiae TaxID=94023 RepID=A0A9N8V903_9GLOM|nr:8340_t:CDS:10 [Acaulospora morrowiae]